MKQPLVIVDDPSLPRCHLAVLQARWSTLGTVRVGRPGDGGQLIDSLFWPARPEAISFPLEPRLARWGEELPPLCNLRQYAQQPWRTSLAPVSAQWMAALRALFPGADLPQHFREDIERGLLRPSFAQEWYRPLDRPWIDADRAAAFPERTLASTIVARRRDGSTDQAIRSLEYLLTIVEHPRTNASTYEEASRLLGVIIREWRQPKELFHRARAWLARRR